MKIRNQCLTLCLVCNCGQSAMRGSWMRRKGGVFLSHSWLTTRRNKGQKLGEYTLTQNVAYAYETARKRIYQLAGTVLLGLQTFIHRFDSDRLQTLKTLKVLNLLVAATFEKVNTYVFYRQPSSRCGSQGFNFGLVLYSAFCFDFLMNDFGKSTPSSTRTSIATWAARAYSKTNNKDGCRTPRSYFEISSRVIFSVTPIRQIIPSCESSSPSRI